MTRRSNLERDLKKIALHFSLKLTHIQILRQHSIGIDDTRRKMILLERKRQHHFRLIDLGKITSCSIKIAYKNIGAGELEDKNMDEFIRRMSLRLDHIDESKSIELIFFSTSENKLPELAQLRYKLDELKDIVSDLIHEQIANRA